MNFRSTCRTLCRAAFIFALGTIITTGFAQAQPLEALELAPGYTARSIEVGIPVGGAMTFNPINPDLMVLSAGNYGEQILVELNLDTHTTRPLSGIIGNIDGIAVLNNGDIVLTENMTSGTILRLRDLTGDNAYFDEDEITELIAPIGVDFAFTGAHMVVAPAGNAAGIPPGSLLIQTADGPGAAEILVIQNPETAPAYFPPDDAWYHGFTYNGGIAFSPDGHVICGISNFPVGQILALVNSNSDNQIDSTEAHEIVGEDVLTNSLSDLAVSRDGIMITTENSGDIRWFQLPDDLTAGSSPANGILAITNGVYLSRVLLDPTDGDFASSGSGPAPTVYISGFAGYPAAPNLLAITPKATPPASAKGWHWLE